MSMQASDLQYHLNPKIEIAAKHVTPNALQSKLVDSLFLIFYGSLPV